MRHAPLTLCCGYIASQVYNESIKDLFVEPGRPSAAVNKHDVRLDKKGRVYVEGLVECEVSANFGVVSDACLIAYFA